MLGTLFAQEAGHGAPSFDILSTLVALPAVGALLVALIPKSRGELHRLVALVFSGATTAMAVWLLAAFEPGEAGYQFEVNRSWVADFGITWHVGVDGISLFLVVLTAVLFPIALLGATPHHDAKPYYAWLLLLEAGCLGVFVALDLFLFFVMFEVVLVPMYFLIGGWGYANRVYAALKFFLFTMFGSALMLVGIVAIAYLHRDAIEDQNRAEAQEIVADAGGEPSEAESDRVAELREGQPLSFDLVEIAEDRNVVDDSERRRAVGLVGRALDLPGVHPRLRGEGAAVPAAHVAARRPHRGAHRGVGDPGRRPC